MQLNNGRRFPALFVLLWSPFLMGQHHPGADCVSCHSSLKFGGTVYQNESASGVASNIAVTFVKPDGSITRPDDSNTSGNIFSSTLPDGKYLITVGATTSKTWHLLPAQRSCNTCHLVGGYPATGGSITMPDLHTSIPSSNDCTDCHHFPASMKLERVKTRGVLVSTKPALPIPGSQVQIGSQVYPFNPQEHSITSTRPDVFAPGFYSMFDVVLATCNKSNIPIEYIYDDSCKTHFITKLNNVTAEFWYHFSYDAGSGNSNEIQFKRANRWDEILWRPGVWIRVVTGENLQEIKNEFREEILRERQSGHMIPQVTFSINPTNYEGNPVESHRITVSKTFNNVQVTPHNFRATGFPSPYSKPFQPGVVTSMDIPLSLMDQGKLSAVAGVFYNYFAGNYIDSYYIVELGFPNIGTAHSSGRQGFVYVTENGTFNKLPNGADNKLHMTSDIHVIHAPDFSYWRWIELGNPYYESNEPITGLREESILDDHNSISRGFNLQAPYPNPFNGEAQISFNIFEPGDVTVEIWNMAGEKVEELFRFHIANRGIQKLAWKPKGVATGVYFIVMKHGQQIQERKLLYLK